MSKVPSKAQCPEMAEISGMSNKSQSFEINNNVLPFTSLKSFYEQVKLENENEFRVEK